MYMNASINDSPTISEVAGAKLTGAAGLFVKYDANGAIVLAGAGEMAIGVLPIDAPDVIESGRDVTVIVKEIVLVKVGAAVAKGDLLASDASGKAIKAVSTKYVNGIAISKTTAADQIIQVQIVKAGVVPA